MHLKKYEPLLELHDVPYNLMVDREFTIRQVDKDANTRHVV